MRLFICAIFYFPFLTAFGQCPYSDSYQNQSNSISYDIELTLDTNLKQAECKQVMIWTNNSPDTINELRFYMYLNAFKDMKSTFLSETRGKVFGRSISDRKENEWGSINISECIIDGINHQTNLAYIQPNDGNVKDQSVLSIQLEKSLLPGEKTEVYMKYISKLPKIIARAGFSRDNYYLFVHWFPQPGVYEEDKQGKWSWNCHQFMQKTEFYADFGNYNVSITAPKDLIIGGSGCKYSETENKDGTKTTKFEARDIIDFAWSAYPYFEEYIDSWKGVQIRMLIPPEHCSMAPRYNGALKNALEYFEDKLGKYPYPSITLIDPPMHALRSGFMEYPMHITCASFYYVPEGIRTIESLAIHEFSHMYYMAILASNEKEEAWLDEGLVTFSEDEILDKYYGGEKKSLFNILGYRTCNKDNSRLEYTSLYDPNCCAIARPGWEFNEGVYKEIIYAKTATVLQTLKGIIGGENMDKVLRHYYQNNKFTHPKEEDLIASVKAIVGNEFNQLVIDDFFEQCLHQTVSCDFELREIDNRSFTVYNNGDLKLPVEIEVTFMNGQKKLFFWNGQTKSESFSTSNDITSINIDPTHKICLDLNFNNNSFTTKPNKVPLYNYTSKALSWLQQAMMASSFIF